MLERKLSEVSRQYFGDKKKPDKAECTYCAYIGDDFILRDWKMDIYCPRCGDKNVKLIYFKDYYGYLG